MWVAVCISIRPRSRSMVNGPPVRCSISNKARLAAITHPLGQIADGHGYTASPKPAKAWRAVGLRFATVVVFRTTLSPDGRYTSGAAPACPTSPFCPAWREATNLGKAARPSPSALHRKCRLAGIAAARRLRSEAVKGYAYGYGHCRQGSVRRRLPTLERGGPECPQPRTSHRIHRAIGEPCS